MKKFLIWFFISPILFLGLWLIGFSSDQIRTSLTEIIEKFVRQIKNNIERSI